MAFDEGLLQAASLDEIRGWLAGRTGALGLPADPRITGMDQIGASSSQTTGNVVDISAASLTTGKAIDVSDLAAITTGKALHIDATGTTQTTGILVHIDSAATAITGAGRLLRVDHTGATTTSGIIAEIASAATDETVITRITGSGALAAGVALDISLASMTTGKAIDISDLAAITTGKALHIDATGVTQTTGILVHVDSAATALTGAGRLLLVDHTGVSTTSGTIVELKTAAADESILLQVTADSLTTGKVVYLTANALTTGVALDMSNLSAITTGKGIHIDADQATQTSGILLHVDSAGTAITGAGRLLRVDHTGATTTSGIIAEIASAATDETTIARVTASAALALGVVLDVSASSLTTGTAVDVGGLDALTTGIGLNITSAATAITGAGRLLYVNLSGATSTSGIVAEIKTDAADETVGLQLTHAGTGEDLKIVNTNTGALGPKIELYHNVGNAASADNDVVGRILFAADDEEAAATKRTVGQIDIQWSDATAASYASDLELYLATGAAANLALTLSGGGQMGLDLDSDLSASSAAGQIFDEYDDAEVLQKYAYLGVDQPEISLATVKMLEAMGVVEENRLNQRGYILKLQPFLRLLCGGIYQTRQRVDDMFAALWREIEMLKAS